MLSPDETHRSALGTAIAAALALASCLAAPPCRGEAPGTSAAHEVAFAFEDEDIRTVLARASELTGIAFVFDPQQVQGHVSIIAPQKVSRDDVLALLRSALAVSGYALLAEGTSARIVPAGQAPHTGSEAIEVVALRHANAEELAAVLGAVLPAGLKVVPYGPTNSLIIAGHPEAVRGAAAAARQRDEQLAGDAEEEGREPPAKADGPP